MSRVTITHFSDVLCVWAYVSQIRCDEILDCFTDQLALDCRFLSVFGDVQDKLGKAWASRGGLEGYAAHVKEVVGRFDHVTIHPETWLERRPASSMPVHLHLCALRLLEQRGDVEPGILAQTTWSLRRAFFAEGSDISGRTALLALAERDELDVSAIEQVLDGGGPHAALAADLEMARRRDVRMSPTLLLNEDRQRLAGNVGYKVIEANVRELLEDPAPEGSWC